MQSPAAAVRVVSDKAETTTRWWRALRTPPISAAQIPAVSAMIGEIPA
jgi:hypothetical protein